MSLWIVEEGRNRKSEIDVSKISKSAAVHKGFDYLIDISIFYVGFIALSIFWLHERTRDYHLFIKKIETIEDINGDLTK